MKKMFKIFWIIISAVIIFSLPVQSQAMSKTNKKAHAAFQKQLKKISVLFVIILRRNLNTLTGMLMETRLMN